MRITDGPAMLDPLHSVRRHRDSGQNISSCSNLKISPVTRPGRQDFRFSAARKSLSNANVHATNQLRSDLGTHSCAYFSLNCPPWLFEFSRFTSRTIGRQISGDPRSAAYSSWPLLILWQTRSKSKTLREPEYSHRILVVYVASGKSWQLAIRPAGHW
jgi:hypothetical protein